MNLSIVNNCMSQRVIHKMSLHLMFKMNRKLMPILKTFVIATMTTLVARTLMKTMTINQRPPLRYLIETLGLMTSPS